MKSGLSPKMVFELPILKQGERIKSVLQMDDENNIIYTYYMNFADTVQRWRFS